MYVGALTLLKSIENLAIVGFPFLKDLSDVFECSSSSVEKANRNLESVTVEVVVVPDFVLTYLVSHSDGVGHLEYSEVTVLYTPGKVIRLITQADKCIAGNF